MSQGRAPSLITIRERGNTKMFRSSHKWPQSGRLHNRPENHHTRVCENLGYHCKATMGLCHEVGARCVVFTANGKKQIVRMPLHWPGNAIILPSKHLLSLSRLYATSNSPGVQKTPTRKQVTIRNDDGRVEWNELTIGEKVARTTQQTFNFGVVLAGLAGTVRNSHRVDL